ncbi:hypothetical protein E3P99_01174 [Wallemia hederae]|uniref:Pentacotripeptide-repeat region of PRORP domain-containing protein n=1 Tax=Wallemia hederae TaxID=1540922 RepID=A0A4T0FRV2_9BASI|nr:hypothetical protein E3P99_01174 [Wallemia hederae]
MHSVPIRARISLSQCTRYTRLTHTNAITHAVTNKSLEELHRALRPTTSEKTGRDTAETGLRAVDASTKSEIDSWLTKTHPSPLLHSVCIELALQGTSRPLLRIVKGAFSSHDAGLVIELFNEVLQRTKDTEQQPVHLDSRILVAVVSAYSLINNYDGARTAVLAAPPSYNFTAGAVAPQTGLSGQKLAQAQSYVDSLRFEYALSSPHTLMHCLHKATGDGMRRYILDLYAALQQREVEVDAHGALNVSISDDAIYASFIKALTKTSKRGSPPLPKDVLDRPLPSLHTLSLNALLGAEVVGHTRVSRVMEILNHLQNLQTLPDQDTVAALISKLIDGRSRTGMDVFDVVQAMHAQCGEPLPVMICNALLSGLTRVGMGDVAMDVFRQMDGASIVTYNILIRAAVLRNDSNTTISLLKQLRERNIQPDAHTFSMLLIYLRKQHHPDAIGVVSKTMTDCSITPDLHIYSNMIDILAKEGLMDDAVRLLDKIENEEGIATTSVTYTSIISAYLAMSPQGLEEAQAMMARMKRRGLAFTHALFQYAITASLQNQHEFAPWVLLEQMNREPNVHITKNTLYILMKGFYDTRRYSDCERLLHFIQSHKLARPTDDAFGRIVDKVRRKLAQHGHVN